MEFKAPLEKKDLAQVKAFFCDIDGTLIDSQSRLREETIAAVRSLPIPFSLVSGRNAKGMEKFYGLLGLKTPKLTLNGAVIVRGREVIASEDISPDVSAPLLESLAKEYGDTISLEAYDCFRWYANTLDNEYIRYEAGVLGFNPDVIFRKASEISSLRMNKILVIGASAVCDRIGKELEPYQSDLQIIRNHDTYIEIFSKNASKGKAIVKASAALGIPLKNTLCAGDSPIDLSMFLTCPYGVAVGNADPIIKSHANIITDANDENGIAHLIQVLNEVRP
jgi:Cof subfamily protein (haloacid dehalogenase superfamily)